MSRFFAMDRLIELRLLGITYNQIESGVYAVLLEETDGLRRLPIIIGYPEAQSIECRLQGVKTPRPLSHDVMASAIIALGASLEKIVISRLDNGVFAASLHLLTREGETICVDSRSSDAIALSLRFDAGIFTTEGVLQEAGYKPERIVHKESAEEESCTSCPDDPECSGYRHMSVARLTMELERCVADEQYELAARIKQIIEDKINKYPQDEK